MCRPLATDPWFLPYTSLTMETEGTWDQSLMTVRIYTRTRVEVSQSRSVEVVVLQEEVVEQEDIENLQVLHQVVIQLVLWGLVFLLYLYLFKVIQ